MAGASIRFEEDRPASVGSRITVEDHALLFEIKDRRIKSVIRPTAEGSQRIDVLDWTTTPQQRLLPRRLMVTDFDREGRIAGVVMLDRTYAEVEGMHVLESQQGTRVRDARTAVPVRMQISDVAAMTPGRSTDA